MSKNETTKEEFKQLFKDCFDLSLEARYSNSGKDFYVCIRDKDTGEIIVSDWIPTDEFKE